MEKYTIITPTTFVAAHHQAIVRLLSQLTTRSISYTEDDYRSQLASPHSPLFLLLDTDIVIGMLTVGTYLSPTGSKAWIEDVVVDDAYRGQGLGRMLVEHAIAYCKEQGIDTLMLTSNPKRIAANALYQSLHFERKETNVYKMKMGADSIR
ncbi:MAG: GNAT family N-acetyltransferase [Bacteroidaceae bacterium]|nr:GNAT family N-acetyltransferase [Bacteroidaceae bacterium]